MGKAVGDALGYPVEGQSPEYVNKEYLPKLEELKSSGISKARQYTDDTQFARELCISLLEMGKFDKFHYFERLVNLYKSRTIVGIGISTDEVLRRYLAGFSASEAASRPPKAGNGSAMRVAPIALFYKDINDVVQYAIEQGEVTHLDPRCSAGSIAIAIGVYQCLNMTALDTDQFINTILQRIKFNQTMYDAISALPELLSLDPAVAAEEVYNRYSGDVKGGWRYISPYVVPSVVWSLYSFLKFPNRFDQAVFCAIGAGGDTDTTGAMTGALSGAFLGYDSIPAHIRQVHDGGKYDSEYLKDLATRLYSYNRTD